tara:strand:+ start:777 stop:1325 length:549 start_codon:yes stop_codon:yes gene_type:complete
MEKNTIVKIIVLVTAILGLYYVITLYQRKQINETDGENEEFNVQEEKPDSDENIPVKASDGSNEVFLDLDEDKPNDTFGLGGNQYPKDCFPKDQLTPAELLPGDANSKWAQSVPAGQGELGDQNFLTSGHHVGVNTVGQTLRNANRQLRSEPPNPQVKVSPWLQTTIEADTNRRPLEIGACD